MRGNYQGLPPAASVEQAIVLAQLLIARELARRTPTTPEPADHAVRRLAPLHAPGRWIWRLLQVLL